MKVLHYSLFICVGILFYSCTSNEPTQVKEKEIPKTVLPQPFRFHKALEVVPGLTYDVLSWGRGSGTSGAYIILRSDSTHLKYRSQTGELDGKIVDAWSMDMDADGNPEIFIQAAGEGEGSYLTLYIYEFDDEGSGQERDFPSLTSSMKKGYKGGDNFYIKDGRLMREFPVYKDDDEGNKPDNGKRLIEYTYRRNSFSAKEVKAEDTKKK